MRRKDEPSKEWNEYLDRIADRVRNSVPEGGLHTAEEHEAHVQKILTLIKIQRGLVIPIIDHYRIAWFDRGVMYSGTQAFKRALTAKILCRFKNLTEGTKEYKVVAFAVDGEKFIWEKGPDARK